MSSLKRLASAVVNGNEGAVWCRPGNELVVVGGGHDKRDRWSGSASEWKRALGEALGETFANFSWAEQPTVLRLWITEQRANHLEGENKILRKAIAKFLLTLEADPSRSAIDRAIANLRESTAEQEEKV